MNKQRLIVLTACLSLAGWNTRADTVRTCSYDSQGRVRQVQCDGRTVTYTYDYMGRV